MHIKGVPDSSRKNSEKSNAHSVAVHAHSGPGLTPARAKGPRTRIRPPTALGSVSNGKIGRVTSELDRHAVDPTADAQR